MNKSMLAILNDSERLFIAETEPAALALLNEDEASDLHTRVLRARKKYLSLYRRSASRKVSAKGGRGKARPTNTTARTKVEIFEDALARVSARLAALARESARQLRDERIADARAAKAGQKPATAAPGAAATKRSVTTKRTGDRAARSPRTEKARASTKSTNARRQAKRDAR